MKRDVTVGIRRVFRSRNNRKSSTTCQVKAASREKSVEGKLITSSYVG